MTKVGFTPSMEVTGVARVTLAAQRHARETSSGMARGVDMCGDLLLSESRKVVPVDTYLLHDTSKVVRRGRGDTRTNEVIYNQPYAARQHEDLTYKHLPGKTAQYLTRPARALRARFQQIVRKEAKDKRRR